MFMYIVKLITFSGISQSSREFNISSTRHMQIHAQCKPTLGCNPMYRLTKICPGVPVNENMSWCAGYRNLHDFGQSNIVQQ